MKNPRLSALVVALLVIACGGIETPKPEPAPEPGTGDMQLPLRTSDLEGRSYRLVGATFEITGPQNATLTDTGEDTLSLRLPIGVYYLELKGDYFLEELMPDGSSERIDATMISPNPLPFTIDEAKTTTVRFLFKLPGAVDVGIRVDRGGWITGKMTFTKLYQGGRPCPCSELPGNTRPFVFSFDHMTVTRLEPGPDGIKKLDVVTGPLTAQFGGSYLDSLRIATWNLQKGGMRIILSASGEGSQLSVEDILVGESGGAFFWATAASTLFTGLLDSDGYPLLPQTLHLDNTFEIGSYNGGIGYSSKVAGTMMATGFIP